MNVPFWQLMILCVLRLHKTTNDLSFENGMVAALIIPSMSNDILPRVPLVSASTNSSQSVNASSW